DKIAKLNGSRRKMRRVFVRRRTFRAIVLRGGIAVTTLETSEKGRACLCIRSKTNGAKQNRKNTCDEFHMFFERGNGRFLNVGIGTHKLAFELSASQNAFKAINHPSLVRSLSLDHFDFGVC